MQIRLTEPGDLARLSEIYVRARQFMSEHGNPRQWGPRHWPPEEVLLEDLRKAHSYVCVNDQGLILGTFAYFFGADVEPTYRQILNGSWQDPSAYGVVHRLASSGVERGVGAFCLNWAFAQCAHLRIDTHQDNVVMQRLLMKLGFVHCGTILLQDNSPRLAYEKTAGWRA